MADAPRFALYMFGTPYYVQKVLLALFEKNEPFAERPVDNHNDENFEPWFMKINPSGKVPVLGDMGRFVPESEDIIDYLDSEISRATRLVPDPSTDLGKEAAIFRKLLDVNIPGLVHGILYNPHLAPQGKAERSQSDLDAIIDGRIAKLEKMASEYPDLKEAYLAKIPPFKRLKEDRRNPDDVQKIMDDLQNVLDLVENRVVKSQGTPGETWLFGNDYTAADISLTMVLKRLSKLGLSSLYFTPTLRPALYNNWQRLQSYRSYCKVEEIAAKYIIKT